jgi:hypothetical protein
MGHRHSLKTSQRYFGVLAIGSQEMDGPIGHGDRNTWQFSSILQVNLPFKLDLKAADEVRKYFEAVLCSIGYPK